ncbi:hypothetical protein CMO83_03105 [Candidatus Woesearchaeota archaeon]|jgi:hypothetical protein|nr:hypothetical protein [Candidatus Woesearchaeota archaeon]|tara:strand:- start:15769 stop:16035 length:267 start_codon:yes stop_codon:yes gene_type:complete
MSLEDKVDSKESKGFMKKALKLGWKLGMAGATTALSMSALPALGASAFLGVAIGGAFAVGGSIAALSNKESLYKTVSDALQHILLLTP